MERNQSRKLSWALVLLITAVICALSFLGAKVIANTTGKNSLGEYRSFALSSNQGVQTVGNGFVYYNGSSLSYVTTDAAAKWTYTVGANAAFDASEAGIAVWSGQTVTVIDYKEGTTEYRGSMDAEILSAKVGDKYVAALLSPEHNSTVVIFETSGKMIDSIAFADQTVVDYGFFSGGTLFWVMTLDTSGTVPTCSVYTYKPGKTIVGSIKDAEQLMYQVMFQSSQVYCVGTTHMKVYDYTGVVEDTSKRKLVYGWYLVEKDKTSDDPMLAFVPDAQYGGTDTMRDVRIIKTGVDQIVRMPFGCSSLVVKDDRVYGFSSGGNIMIAQAGAQEMQAFSIGISGGAVVGVTNNRVAVITAGDMAYLVNLP